MKAYKGFNEDMTCRNFQYEEGKEYEEENAALCLCGFHACLSPLDVFKYYNPTTSVYHEVDLSGRVIVQSDTNDTMKDSKICGTNIKIGPAIELSDYVREGISYISNNSTEAINEKSIDRFLASFTDKSKISNENLVNEVVCNSGLFSLSSAENSRNIAVNTGSNSVAITHDHYGIAVISKPFSVAATDAKASVAVSSGDESITESYGSCSLSIQIGAESIADSTGRESVSVNRGGYGKAQASGKDSSAIVAGPCSEAIVSEVGSIACALGGGCKAKGCVGSWLLLSEWKCKGTYEDSGRSDIRLFYVDGEKVKADTFYALVNGQLTEA